MSITDAIGTITRIQATLTQLNTGRPAATGPSTPDTNTRTSDAFAQALTAAGTVPGSPAAPAVPGTATGQGIADAARKYLGVPYVWGGTDPATGLDCSGLVQRVYKDLGIDVPRVAADQGNAGKAVANLAEARAGDLLVMNGGQHIGIFMGNNEYLHAPAPGQAVRTEAIPAGAVFDKISRIIPHTPAAPTTGPVTSTAGPDLAALLSRLQSSAAARTAG